MHPREDVQAALGDIIRRTVQRGGSVLLPAFAVGRAQALMLVLQRLKRAGDIPPSLPIFLDSPMAIAATDVTLRHRKLLAVPRREIDTLTDGVHFIETGAQSQRLSRSRYPSVIISASGMATGGRVLHHLQAMAPERAPPHRLPGLPGRRHARRAHGGGRARGQDLRRDGAGARRGQPPRRLLGPRRCRRVDAVGCAASSGHRATPS